MRDEPRHNVEHDQEGQQGEIHRQIGAGFLRLHGHTSLKGDLRQISTFVLALAIVRTPLERAAFRNSDASGKAYQPRKSTTVLLSARISAMTALAPRPRRCSPRLLPA